MLLYLYFNERFSLLWLYLKFSLFMFYIILDLFWLNLWLPAFFRFKTFLGDFDIL